MKRPGVRRCANATCSGPVRGWGGPRGSHHGDYIPELNSRVASRGLGCGLLLVARALPS